MEHATCIYNQQNRMNMSLTKDQGMIQALLEEKSS